MLNTFQNVYVRLCVDGPLRARFLRQPEQVLDEHTLAPRERDALLGLDPEALARFAESLLSKRCDEFGPHVRMTRRVCPDVVARYRRWLWANPAKVTDSAGAALPPGLSEALRALDALRADMARDEGVTPYAAALLAFEVWEDAARRDGHVRILRARWRLDDIMADLRRGFLPAEPDEGRWLFRFSREGVEWRTA
jgi:hypothetical protein